MFKRWLRRSEPARLQVLMVCMGNLCRSPMAQAVLQHKLQQAGLAGSVQVDSAGTHGFHKGSRPDPRAVAQAALRGYALDGIKSRPLLAADFTRFDLVLAMDRGNLEALQQRCPPAALGRLGLLLPYAANGAVRGPGSDEVPDPYYGSLAGFDRALDLIEPACDGLLRHLQQRLVGVA